MKLEKVLLKSGRKLLVNKILEAVLKDIKGTIIG